MVGIFRIKTLKHDKIVPKTAHLTFLNKTPKNVFAQVSSTKYIFVVKSARIALYLRQGRTSRIVARMRASYWHRPPIDVYH